MSEYTQLLIALVGICIAVLGYFLSRRRHKDEQSKTFRDLHEIFWTDPEIKAVRKWIACDQAYESVSKILETRRLKPSEISSDDYDKIEKLDRFLNFLNRVNSLSIDFHKDPILWEKLFLSYWLEHFANESNRKEFRLYLQQHYKNGLWEIAVKNTHN